MRFSLWFSFVAIILSGCAGPQSQPPALGSLPGTATTINARVAEHSRMLAGSSGDLIYATGGCGGTCVVSYPGGQLAGALPTSGAAVCSDSKGNVFISGGSNVVEYAHGGTTPIATLELPGNLADGCSVDPTTNNLAVVFKGIGVDIAIFPNEGGSPTLYGSNIDSLHCGHDNNGNLFVDGYSPSEQLALSELSSGKTTFKPLSISPDLGQPGQVQWDGKNITLQAENTGKIYRLAISGSTATVVGTTSLRKVTRGAGASWISGRRLIAPFPLHGSRDNKIGIWKYPRGGKATSIIREFGEYRGPDIDFNGVTLSVDPSFG